jgi:hypothetical protein
MNALSKKGRGDFHVVPLFPFALTPIPSAYEESPRLTHDVVFASLRPANSPVPKPKSRKKARIRAYSRIIPEASNP